MGKKSKRRTGKRSQKMPLEVAGTQAKEVEVKIDDMIVYEDEEEFMMWSLGDNKADLTPKKFAKMNPRMAMKLIAGDVSVDEILQKREKMLAKIEG